MKALDKNNQIGIAAMLGPKDQFIEKATTATKLEVKDIEDKITLGENKIAAISQLQTLTSSLRVKSTELAKIATDYNAKKVALSTQDIASADSYIKVTVDNTAQVASSQISVQQVATASYKTIGAGATTGFSNDTGPKLNGTLKINGTDVLILPSYSASDIVSLINSTSPDCTALLVNNATNNTSFIEIRSKTTGTAGTVTLNWTPTDSSTFDTCVNVAGVNASVTVDGLVITQGSNIFTNLLQGVTVELTGKVNSAGCNQTINVKLDETALLNALDEMVDVYNDLSLFVAKQEETTGTYNEFDDPMIDQGSKVAKSAYLKNTGALRDAHDLLETLFSPIKNTSGIGSIFDIGLGLKSSIPSDGQPAADIIYVADQTTFKKQFATNLNGICELFTDNNQITPNGLNNGSSMTLAIIAKPLVASFVNVPVSITLDGNSAITGASTVLNGTNMNCTIEQLGGYSYIVFPSNSPLDGVKLYFNPNGVTNNTENFTFSFSPGLTTLINNEAVNIISPDGKSGSSIVAAANIKSEIQTFEKQQKLSQDYLDKIIKDIEAQYRIVEDADFKAGFLLAALEAALGVES